MTLYIWNSKAFQNYGDGTITVSAGNLEAAHEAAHICGAQKLKDDYSWDIDNDILPEKLEELRRDLNNEPVVSDTGVWIIPGSD